VNLPSVKIYFLAQGAVCASSEGAVLLIVSCCSARSDSWPDDPCETVLAPGVTTNRLPLSFSADFGMILSLAS
jgi:hypothetical protein